MPGSLSHLTARFFDVLLARPLTSEELTEVEGWLPGDMYSVFCQQASADQRHSFHAATRVIDAGFEDEAVTAALMHDIGKRHSRLGVVGRTVASLLILAGLPMTERMRSYRDHGSLAADELADLGAPQLAIEYARHHHGSRPASIAADVWDVLVRADEPPNTRTLVASRIR